MRNLERFPLRGLEFTLEGDRGPIAEARVRWRVADKGTTARSEWTEGATDSHGRFAVPDIQTGDWEVEVCAEGYFPLHGIIQIDPRTRGHQTIYATRMTRPAADRVRVLEPTSLVRVDVGKPVHVTWRIENGPVDPAGWEVRVSILGCAEAMSVSVIHAEPFRKAEGSFTWRATQEVVDWIRANEEGSQAGIQLPIMVCLYNATGRGQPLGVLKQSEGTDEELAMLETCHAAGDHSWIVCGDTSDDDGQGRLALPGSN